MNFNIVNDQFRRHIKKPVAWYEKIVHAERAGFLSAEITLMIAAKMNRFPYMCAEPSESVNHLVISDTCTIRLSVL